MKIKIDKKTKDAMITSSPYFLIAMVFGLAGIYIIQILGPPVKPVDVTWNAVLMFMGVCAGIGWIFHGTGFLLIRVSK